VDLQFVILNACYLADTPAFMKDSELNHLIAPEISRDRFWRALRRVASIPGIEHILEISSSSGEGSTSAFVAGILENPTNPLLHCFEISTPRLESLKKRYASYDFIRYYNSSTVSLDRFSTQSEVAEFHSRFRPKLRRPSIETQFRWLQQDIDYIEKHNLSSNGIQLLKSHLDIDYFDVVLIDGSEFTGKAEMEDVYGTRFLFLDDILTFKNYENYRCLQNDHSYELLEKSRWRRNGYAVFKRV
jgi:hypothetical protein